MIFLGTGSVLAYAFDAAFYKVNHGWRYMIAIGAIPSIVLGVLLFWCPEYVLQLREKMRNANTEQVSTSTHVPWQARTMRTHHPPDIPKCF